MSARKPNKLVAIDLDGTLITHRGEVAEADRQAIAAMRARGVHVTLCTGRLYSGTRPTAHHVGITGPIACIDGSQIVDCTTDRPLYDHTVRGDHIEHLRSALSPKEVACFLFANDEIGHDDNGEMFLPYVRLWSTKLKPHHSMDEHPHWDHPDGVSEVVCVGAEHSIRETVSRILAKLEHHVQVASFPVKRSDGHVWGMVARAAGPTKGTAIEWLAKFHGCSVDDVIVIGDWLNDIPMFEVAGRSFAMGQAPEQVKAKATDVLEATAYEGGGVAEAAKKAGLL
ncbi:MAG: HAD hydrolase family protein [Polyangiaceae bacterium]